MDSVVHYGVFVGAILCGWTPKMSKGCFHRPDHAPSIPRSITNEEKIQHPKVWVKSGERKAAVNNVPPWNFRFP
jgi:hypothetical protein